MSLRKRTVVLAITLLLGVPILGSLMSPTPLHQPTQAQATEGDPVQMMCCLAELDCCK
jgi:hypothetical protein